MIFRDGFDHADPHPGNLMLLPEGVVGVLDLGMVQRLDDDLREAILSTTQRYMHVSPSAINSAIRLLEFRQKPKPGRQWGHDSHTGTENVNG